MVDWIPYFAVDPAYVAWQAAQAEKEKWQSGERVKFARGQVCRSGYSSVCVKFFDPPPHSLHLFLFVDVSSYLFLFYEGGFLRLFRKIPKIC